MKLYVTCAINLVGERGARRSHAHARGRTHAWRRRTAHAWWRWHTTHARRTAHAWRRRWPHTRRPHTGWRWAWGHTAWRRAHSRRSWRLHAWWRSEKSSRWSEARSAHDYGKKQFPAYAGGGIPGMPPTHSELLCYKKGSSTYRVAEA